MLPEKPLGSWMLAAIEGLSSRSMLTVTVLPKSLFLRGSVPEVQGQNRSTRVPVHDITAAGTQTPM